MFFRPCSVDIPGRPDCFYLFNFFEGNRGGVELGEGGVGVLRGVEGGEAAVKMVLYERRIKVLKNIEWKTLLHR